MFPIHLANDREITHARSRAMQLLTSPFILRILAAKPCCYGTTLLVCDPGSPRVRASDRPSSRVQGSPAPCLTAHPQAPEERTRELGS